MNIEYDTHSAIQRLRDSRTTKADIALIQNDIEMQRLATQKDIEIIHKDIESLRQETKANIEVLRQETKAGIEAAKNSVVLWVVGLNVALGVCRV